MNNPPYQLIAGDALNIIPTLENDSIHCVLSDIPYGINLDDWDVLHTNTNSALLGQSPAQLGKSGFKRRGKPINGWSASDKNIPKEYQQWCYSWTSLLFPKLKEGASLFIFGARRTLHRAIIAFEDSGFLLKDVLSWEKPNAHHRAQKLNNILEKRGLDTSEWEGWRLGNLAPRWEPIAWFFKPYAYTITDTVLENGLGAINIGATLVDGKSPSNILKFWFDTNEKRYHEAQKPVSLLEFLISLTTKENQIILDPFMGSGSTGVACSLRQRQFIGIDINPDYTQIAQKRIEESLQRPKQPLLF
jgi:site-specific DNA-methyltransferase (adenine-specific)